MSVSLGIIPFRVLEEERDVGRNSEERTRSRALTQFCAMKRRREERKETNAEMAFEIYRIQ